MKKIKKTAITVFKISISLVLLYFVFRKVPFSEVWNLVKRSDLLFLFFALAAFIASQWLSSERLLRYFRAYHFNVSSAGNWKLYLIGMFYNFFIPGGIGGDAYKVIVLNRKFGWSVKQLTASVFCDRLSGLLAIVILVQVLALPVLPGGYKLLVVPSVLLSVVVVHGMLKKFFAPFRSVFVKTLFFSLAVQLLQLLSIYFILKSFSGVQDIWIYFMVFLLSAVLSVISFSGIGVREWLFMQAAHYFTFDVGISVSTAMLFSFMTALVSLFGIWFQIRKFEIADSDPV